jgi:DNA modification methylase
VLDPCAGGGTTGLACLELGRHAVLIDRDAEAIGKTRDRLREAGAVL